MNKLKSLAEVKKITARLKKLKKKIVFTNGCFDILHYGHIVYLEKCKRLGDILIVGLNSDSSVRKIKGLSRPVMREKERAAILSALYCVDHVVTFNEKTPEKIIREISPDVLAKGTDWRKKDIVGKGHVEKSGGRVATVPFVKGYSTTRLIKKIKHSGE